MAANIRKRKITYKQEKVIFGILFLSPWIVGLIFVFFSAILDSFLYSFSTVHFISGNATVQEVQAFISGLEHTAFQKSGVILEWVGFDNYRYALLEHGTFNRVLVDSVIDITLNLPIIIIFSLLVAVMLNTKFKGNVFARAVFFLPVIIASDAITTALSQATLLQDTMGNVDESVFGNFEFQGFLLEAGLGEGIVSFLSDTVNQIFHVISYSGVQILIFLAGIQSIPSHLYEAAKIEGANSYQSFWKITMPMVSPHVLTVGIYTIIDSFVRAPITDLILQMKDNLLYGYSASMAWIYFVIVILIIGIFIGLMNKVVFYYDN
jgi:ABC-type sugar transport system permease subunit